jgi:hypothetical protein
MSEFRTSEEAERMLRELSKASKYCTGENSSRQHMERIRKVQAEADRLREKGK